MFKRRRGIRYKTFGLIFFTIFLATFTVLFVAPKFTNKYQKPENDQNIKYNTNNNPTQQISLEPQTDTIVTRAASRVLPSVVGISTVTLGTEEIFDSGGAGKWGVGSGVILSQNGYIITNYHVAGGKKKILVTLDNGDVVDGKTVWGDTVLDLAMVKIEGKGLPVAALGDNENIKVGDVAIAIGNPLGLQFQRTVTSGVISGLNRTIGVDTEQGPNYMEDLIQTDAIINPGNSGGPLINASGEVIGINTVKIVTAEGMGFAIPINIIKPIINGFIAEGKYVEPYIGIFAYDRNIINYMNNGLKLDKGIYLANVNNDGPAYKSGLREGDIITHIDNIEVNTMLDLRTYMYNKGPGKSIDINYYSNNRLKTSKIKLEISPDGYNGIAR